MTPTLPPIAHFTLSLTRCTSRGSNPDLRILSPPLSPLKVLVPVCLTHRHPRPLGRGPWRRRWTHRHPRPDRVRSMGYSVVTLPDIDIKSMPKS
jgi:hypothetical protein